MIDLSSLTIAAAAKAFKAKEFSSRELTEAYLEHIAKKNPDVHAYLEVFDDALTQADMADQRINRADTGALTGIPVAVKDNILIAGKKASAGSKILHNFTAPYDATAISKLKKEGVVFLGRTNMDEFAMGSSTENSAFGVTKNPHDLGRVAGGSSGGSAAAVAMDGALAALGSDTGGSVRQPASFCGVVGFKPTYGAVSRSGLIAMGSSLDQIGSLTKSVSDAELIFKTMSGHDVLDSTSLPDISSKGAGKRIGVPRTFMEQGIDPDVRAAFDASIEAFRSLGYEIHDIELFTISYSLPIYYVIMFAESSTNLERFDGVKYGLRVEGGPLLEDYLNTRTEGFGPEVRRRIMLGTYVLSAGYYDAYYNRAQALRNTLQHDFHNIFKEVDMILTPTSPTPAFKIGEKTEDPLSMYLADVFTVTANLVGIPAISLPSGTVGREGRTLPVGIQLMAPHRGENILFSAGKAYLKEE